MVDDRLISLGDLSGSTCGSHLINNILQISTKIQAYFDGTFWSTEKTHKIWPLWKKDNISKNETGRSRISLINDIRWIKQFAIYGCQKLVEDLSNSYQNCLWCLPSQ